MAEKTSDKKKGTKTWSKLMGMSVASAKAKKQSKKNLDKEPK